MRSDVDWEILHLTEEQTATTYQHSISAAPGEVKRRVQGHTRLRLAMNGRLGDVVTDGIVKPGRHESDQALQRTLSGPGLHMALGTTYSQAQPALQETPGPGPLPEKYSGLLLRVVQRHRTVRLSARGGGRLDWTAQQVRRVYGYHHHGSEIPLCCPVEEVPSGLWPQAEVERPISTYTALAKTWMWSPIALSGVLREQWTAALLSEGEQPAWPESLAIADGPRLGITDFEGTPIRCNVLVQGGAPVTRIRTLCHAEEAAQLTGHGGLSGAVLESLWIDVDKLADPPKGPVHVVVGARQLGWQSDVFVLTMLSTDFETQSVPIRMVARIHSLEQLAEGQWIPPHSYGTGGWISPWLSTDTCGQFMELLCLEDEVDGAFF